ncbi:hypothetical protein HELRODRAFT_91651, partial [Helobdella robusta]|uniref:Protein regulator of cytokinesis 1 n=1 Tax=Helobdella robusta TaxID=6412 RepID=T1G872_HELRO
LEVGISKLMEIWTDLGLNRKDVLLRKKVMLGHLRDLLDDMVREEESTRQSILNSVKAYHQEVLKLCGELKLEPYNPNEELTVLQLEKDLRLKLESLQKEKAKKMERLKSLSRIDQELCNLLCEIPFYVPSGIVPSEEQLNELDKHIRKLEDEKVGREQILKQTKEQVKEMLLQLDIPLASQFEQDVINESDDSFVLSSENMKLLAKKNQQLQKRLRENIETAERLTTELYYLWDQLGISITERTQFSEEYTGIKQRTILALNEEINRCKILKIQNASMIIGSLRKQLDKLWDRCYIPMEQRKMFKGFYSDEWNEEVLVKHEEEIRMLKAYYEEHKSLFEKVQHRDMVWEQFLEFERRASNPNRLFDKGWSLLQEEKERKKITKELPRIENEVMEEIDLWQKKMNKTFLINGFLYQDYIKMQWDDYRTHKENEKHSRQQNKQRKTEEEMLFGSRPHVTPVKKPLISITGGSKSSSKNSAKVRDVLLFGIAVLYC